MGVFEYPGYLAHRKMEVLIGKTIGKPKEHHRKTIGKWRLYQLVMTNSWPWKITVLNR
jgi:hypothetical protein